MRTSPRGDRRAVRSNQDVDPEALFYKHHALSYHQLLRRAFTSNVNAELLGTLIGYWRENDTTELRLALDGRRLLPADQFSGHDGEGLLGWPTPGRRTPRRSNAGRHHPPHWQFLVRWSYDPKQGQKTCDMEELLWVLVRYMHSIRGVRQHVLAT